MHSHAKQHIKYMNTLVQRVCTYAADDKWTLNFKQWVSPNAHENNMSNSYTFLCIGYARMLMHGVIWVRYQVYKQFKSGWYTDLSCCTLPLELGCNHIATCKGHKRSLWHCNRYMYQWSAQETLGMAAGLQLQWSLRIVVL